MTRGKARVEHLQAIWPNFECFVHGGVPITPFHDELRSVLGPTVNFHEVYPASEGFIAAQDADSAAGLRLMADAGVFYEFLPMWEFDEARIPTLGEKAVPIAGVKAGVDYALVMTTPAGFARYVIGDVVRFVSTKPARLDLRGQDEAAAERLRRARDREGDHRRALRRVPAQRLDHQSISTWPRSS